MKILESRSETYNHVTGRLSDGSDRVVTPVTKYIARVSNHGEVRTLEFDHAPTFDELLESTKDITVTPTTKAGWEEYVTDYYDVWQRWKNTRAEAQARGAAAAVITALTNRENNAWTDYLAALNQWRTAP